MVGTVLRETFAAHRRLLVPTGAAAAIVFAPLAAALLALELAVGTSTRTVQGLAVIDAVGSLLLFAPVASIIAIRCQIAVEAEAPARPAHEAGPALQLLPRYVLTQLLVLLVIAGPPVALILAGLAIASPGLVTIGIGALFASALINGVRFGLATIAVAVGDAAYATAVRRSRALVRGRYWGTLGVLAALSALAFVLALAVSSIALAAPQGDARTVLEALLGVAANAIAVPFISIGLYRLYRTLARDADGAPAGGS